MTYNLIEQAWIPVRLKDGTRAMIEPWRVTDGGPSGDNPPMEVAAPRADFGGALVQFLIGLLQTTAAPEDEKQWRGWLLRPPPPQELRKAFMAHVSAFNLDGDGPRFLQDLELREGDQGSDVRCMDTLLIDCPGENTVKKNSDHFVKRNQVQQICAACSATALLTLQLNAPSGGQGHRVSLRGGGPLTTILLGESLWQTSWLNVLLPEQVAPGDPVRNEPEVIFPWLAPTVTSECDRGVTPMDADPLQAYWGMSRRIRLLEPDASEGTCGLCGDSPASFFYHYVTKNRGIKYSGAWVHPLTPYQYDNKGQPLSNKRHKGGLSFRHWLGVIQGHQDKQRLEPALVVRRMKQVSQRSEVIRELFPSEPRIWAFGYAMDNMKARCFYDSRMPLILVKEEFSADYEALAANLVLSSQFAAKKTEASLKKAWFRRPADRRGDMSGVAALFDSRTEAGFYATLDEARTLLRQGDDLMDFRRRWLKSLRQTGLAIFDEMSQAGLFSAVDPKRVSLARRGLGLSLSQGSKEMRAALGLPDPPRKTKKSAATPKAEQGAS